MRQALRFGVVWTVIGLAALIWPLVFSLLAGNVVATLVAYGLAFAIDCVVFALWLRRAVGYSRRAGRGETFTVGKEVP